MVKRWMVGLMAATLCASAVLAAEDGAGIYLQKCKKCHGDDGTGNARMAKGLKLPDPAKLSLAATSEMTDDEIRKIITEGKGKMPEYASKLTPAEIGAVLAYCRTLAPAKKP